MYCLHRSAQSFPSPDAFLPHRWLPAKAQTQDNIPLNAYRPFERGPRSCIAQELALTELKVIMALTARRFSFRPAYEEMHRRKGRSGAVPQVEHHGGQAYPVFMLTPQPKDGLPMWVAEAAVAPSVA